MDFSNYLANLKFIFITLLLLGIFFPLLTAHGQGFNNNEWIFGNCEGTAVRNYISFGKDGIGRVKALTGLATSQPYSSGNSALAIDPITGKILFYTNGNLVFNYYNDNITPGSGLEGQDDGIQTVAISPFEVDFDSGTPKLYYIFYITTGGQLAYAVADMANQGAAPPGQPAAGLITPGGNIGPATGAIITVNTPGSSNFIISFNGGQLEAREVGATQGEFTLMDQVNINSEPKKIIFDEESGTLLIIPSDPAQPMITLTFDTESGTFGTPQPLTQTAGGDKRGAAFSPDGTYIYYSQNNAIFRIPVADPTATPEEIPLPEETTAIYDLRVGPDGQLYYIYQEANNDAFYVGRITNPEEEDIAEIEVEHNPFNGTDFCGTVFPVFATDANIDPVVDFTWEPEMPCQNNPIQLTSSINPQNYRPVSFEWSFNPPLVDEDGEEIEADYNQEHFLLPEGATGEESVEVTLTVTFADGTTRDITKTISLTPNELQADFTPQDTTVCEGTCVDISALLEASMGEGQEGGAGGIGSGGGDNLEYLWSDIRTWGPKERPCITDKPGLYWVLVRDPANPECTAYASIRIKVWDIDDPRNNIWYFGNGAGLDFNPDPDDPDGPVPRPIEERHPQDIPAGVTTISDASGQVLFYSDGETVWDANHTELATDIGGDRFASQSVLAVPIPQDETLFYLFTVGNGQAKFTVVDIKGSPGGAGFGSVNTSDNFLFSPSSDKIAAVGAGDTTWVAFHELGNNTFRFYPVTAQGIGPPVFSSVGSNHNFGTVGSMKFSPDGTKLAVTINDGGTNRLEIFDFDPSTGALTEYALLDLGSDGNIYGLEFSNDGSRVYVSYTGNKSRIEEFKIEPVEECYECFDENSDRDTRETCIKESKIIIDPGNHSGSNFGSLQIGPDGQIYVAREGADVVGQIQVGQDCEASFYNAQAHDAMPGAAQLGLPAFINNDGSSIPEPLLEGPERLCLDEEGRAVGLFGAGGEPDIDFYRWTIFNPSGEEVYSQQGREEAQDIEYIFQFPGTYTVRLNVDRCTEVDYYDSEREGEDLRVLVVAPPAIILPADATLCAGQPIPLRAIALDDPRLGEYVFEWRNAAGELVGDENEIEVTEESIYTVFVSFALPEGEDEETFATCPASASVFVGPAFEFDVEQGAEEVCLGEEVTFVPDTPILGNWYYLLEGEEERVLIGEFYELELETDEMQGAGIYTIIFVVEDPIIADCLIEKTFDLIVNPLPAFTASSLNPDVDCENNDGLLQIEAIGDIQELLIEETGVTYTLTAGETVQIADLAPGNYTLTATNGDCSFTQTVTIENANPPVDYQFEVEIVPNCEMEGGYLEINFPNGPVSGTYEIIRQGDGQAFTGNFTTSFVVDNLTEGDYAVEIFTPAGCSIPDPDLYTIIFDQVDFSIPTSAISCGPYQLIPNSNQTLEYTVLDPNGNTVTPEADGSFLLDIEGTYTVTGEDTEAGTNLCPIQRQITVTLEEPITFDIQPPTDLCGPNQAYVAILNGRNPADLIIRWRNEAGEIVSRSQIFNPTAPGEYTLEVTPRGSANCVPQPESITVAALPTNIPVELSSPTSCAFEGAYITANANIGAGLTIRWFLDGVELVAFEGMMDITAVEEGIYSVIITNANDCVVGEDDFRLFESELEPIVLEESYTICAIEGFIIPINPGTYDSYEWIFDGDIVSTDSIFSPTQPGEYTLRVRDSFGCELVEEFLIIEDCNPAIRAPSAMKLGRANQNFVIYANEFVNYVQVLIYNRWGELIHVDETNEVAPNTAILPWDGTVRGKNVPIGTYPVIIRFRSDRQNLTQEVKRALLILE